MAAFLEKKSCRNLRGTENVFHIYCKINMPSMSRHALHNLTVANLVEIWYDRHRIGQERQGNCTAHQWSDGRRIQHKENRENKKEQKTEMKAYVF